MAAKVLTVFFSSISGEYERDVAGMKQHSMKWIEFTVVADDRAMKLTVEMTDDERADLAEAIWRVSERALADLGIERED